MHSAEERVRLTSLQGMALHSKVQASKAELATRRARLLQQQATLESDAELLQRVAQRRSQAGHELATQRKANEIASGELQKRQARELAALQGVLPVRVSGVAQRSRKAMQVLLWGAALLQHEL